MVVSSDFHTYKEYSHAFIEILRGYSETLEQVSIDEAYLDVTELSLMNVRKHLLENVGDIFGSIEMNYQGKKCSRGWKWRYKKRI